MLNKIKIYMACTEWLYFIDKLSVYFGLNRMSYLQGYVDFACVVEYHVHTEWLTLIDTLTFPVLLSNMALTELLTLIDTLTFLVLLSIMSTQNVLPSRIC